MRFFLVEVFAATAALVSQGRGASAATKLRQNATGTIRQTIGTNKGRDASTVRKLGTNDPLVIDRYMQVPEGARKHPSYYSETYLRRARPVTATEQSGLDTTWGKWEYTDPKALSHPDDSFYESFPNRDVPRARFPANAWQIDSEHLSKFLPEAVRLTERALEAILTECGRGKNDMPQSTFEERSLVFQPSLDGGPGGGGGTMSQKSYEGLKRRIWHAVMSEDRFTIALGGHSAAAGHGNHFQQSYTLQVQRILEPIFARLGVKMSSRNFGMGGLGTLHSSVGSGDIYGKDVDILMWDSGMTEREKEARGIMAIQALVGIDRAPFLWFERDEKEKILEMIHNFTGADVAIYGHRSDDGLRKHPVTVADLEKLPWALQYLDCPGGPLKEYCLTLRYNGTCWRDRSSFTWEGVDLSYTPETPQQAALGGRVGWHPGNREHQTTARSFTFTILLALRDVLNSWNGKENYSVDDKDWHVTDHYASIKAKILEKKENWAEWCKAKKIPWQFCAHGAKGRTENTPRNRPWATSLRAIMAGSEHPDINLGKNLYDPPDLYIPELDPPEGQLDVLAIVENGVSFQRNLARVHDSAQDMQGRDFSQLQGKGSKHNPDITGGRGWQFRNNHVSAGSDNCDGELGSWCRRSGGCLLYGHNDGRVGLVFDGFSGWMIFNLQKVEHGVIMIQMHSVISYAPGATVGWFSENDVDPCKSGALADNAAAHSDTTTHPRMLNAKAPPFCDDFKFEYAVDGNIISWDKDEFVHRENHAQRVVQFWTLMDDSSWDGPRDVELAIRVTGCGRDKPMELTHIYWI